MAVMELSGLDLNLLVAFDALMDEPEYLKFVKANT